MRSKEESLRLEPEPGISGYNLARPKVKLTRSIDHRRSIIIDITQEFSTIFALNLGSFPLNTPVIKGLKERSDFVLLFKLEFIWVDP